jgi:hypothetical protein
MRRRRSSGVSREMSSFGRAMLKVHALRRFRTRGGSGIAKLAARPGQRNV